LSRNLNALTSSAESAMTGVSGQQLDPMLSTASSFEAHLSTHEAPLHANTVNAMQEQAKDLVAAMRVSTTLLYVYLHTPQLGRQRHAPFTHR
jgi:hypothetical protein